MVSIAKDSTGWQQLSLNANFAVHEAKPCF